MRRSANHFSYTEKPCGRMASGGDASVWEGPHRSLRRCEDVFSGGHRVEKEFCRDESTSRLTEPAISAQYHSLALWSVGKLTSIAFTVSQFRENSTLRRIV